MKRYIPPIADVSPIYRSAGPVLEHLAACQYALAQGRSMSYFSRTYMDEPGRWVTRIAREDEIAVLLATAQESEAKALADRRALENRLGCRLPDSAPLSGIALKVGRLSYSLASCFNHEFHDADCGMCRHAALVARARGGSRQAMTFDEAMDEGTRVSRAEALAEVARHSVNPDEMLTELGDREEYTSKQVLEFLGY